MQIYILNRARETLATTASIYDDKHTLTLEAGSSSYEFTIDKSDEASKYLDSGNYIVLQDDAGKAWLFTILDYEETHSTKTVYAEDAGIELINKAMDIWPLDGPHSFEYYFNLVTKDTPWKLGINQLEGLSRSLKYDGRDTGLGRLLSILKGFDDAECTFDVTVKMNAPADFKINVYKKVGSDRSDVQIVYNSELNDIKKKESRAEFVTALAGVGGQIQSEDGTDKGNVDFSDLEYNKDGFVTTKGDKFLRAVNANRTFNPGHESYIENFYEYDTQSPSELLNRTLSRLKIYSEPQYTYNAEVKVIDSSLVIGDTVTILDHDYNPALYLSARVAKLVKSYTDPTRNEIEFTNYRLLTSSLSDKLAKIQVMVNTLPSAAKVQAIETNLGKVIKQQEELTVQIKSADGKSTNFYGSTAPINPRQGDSWFYTDEEGNRGIKQYQDGVWVDIISSKFGPKLKEDIKKAQADVDEIIRKANNDTTIFRTEGQEAAPAAKKKGDLWFKADNGQTIMHEWDGQKWHEIVSTKTTEDITKQVEQAQADLTQVRADANRISETQTESAKRLDEQMKALQAKTSDNATNVQNVIRDVAQAHADYVAQQADISKQKADLEKTRQDLLANSESIEDFKGKVSKFQVDLDGINSQVVSNTGAINQFRVTENEINQAMKDAQGNIETLKLTAKGFEQQFADTNGNIASVKRSTTELSEQLASKVGNTEYQNFKTQTAKELSQKLVRTDLNGYATTAEVKLTADGLKEQYNSVKSKVDGLKIGGVNLINNGGNPKDTDGWSIYGINSNHRFIVNRHNFWKNAQETLFTLFNSNSSEVTMSSNRFQVERNTECTLSYWAFADSNVVSSDTYFVGKKNGETSDTKVVTLISGRVYPGVKAEYVTVTFNTGDCDEGYIRFDNNGSRNPVREGPGHEDGLYLANIQLEKGTIPSDWGPSAKDMEDAISGVSKDLTNYKAVVERDYAKNSSVYTKNEVVNLTNNSKDSAVNAIKNDTNWKGLININTNSAFLQTADGFEKEVVKKATPMIGGGKNLARGTSDSWQGVRTNEFNGNDNQTFLIGYAYLDQLSAGDSVTISCRYQYSGVTASNAITRIQGNGNVTGYDSGQLIRPEPIALEQGTDLKFGAIKYTFKLNSQMVKNEYWEVRWRFDHVNQGACFQWLKFKVEKGTVATPWTPAPEDLATVVSVNKVIDTSDSHTQIIKDYLTNDNSQFKILKDSVSQKVQKGDVIGQINLEAGKTLIQNQKVYLDADTVTFSNKAFIPSAAITSLDAGKITTGTLDAARLNVINLNANAINAGTLSGEYLHITKQTSIDNGVIQGAKIADASIGTAKIADAAITSAKIANLDVNKLSGNKSTFVQSVWNGISNSVNITPTGLESTSGSNQTTITGGRIETNSLWAKDYITVGRHESDPRQRWGIDIDRKGMWFGVPVKKTGAVGNNAGDYQYEIQGAIKGYGWDYARTEINGNGASGIMIGLTEQTMWGDPYGGDFIGIGKFNKNQYQSLDSPQYDFALTYNATSAGFAVPGNAVHIWKDTYIHGVTHLGYDGTTKNKVGIRTAWVSWSDWHNERYACLVNDGPNWGGIAFPYNGNVVLFNDGGLRFNIPATGTGDNHYNGYGDY